MKAQSEFPCPHCAEPIAFSAAADPRPIVCPACDTLVTMPPPPADSPMPGKPTLPSRRVTGAPPRAFADEADAASAAGEPPLAPPSPEFLAHRSRTALPSHRERDRHLPSMTPAPYQSEPVPTPTAAPRADLPGRRASSERPRRRAPSAPPDPPRAALEDPSTLPAADAPPPPTEPAPSRPINHRLGSARHPEFQPQATVNFDPEDTGDWGGFGGDATASRTRSRKLIMWAILIAVPLAAAVIWQSVHRAETAGAVAPDPSDLPVPGSDAGEVVRRASDVVTQFLATRTIDERAAFVRHPEVTKPRMERWYTAANPLKPSKPLTFHDRSTENTIDGVNFLILFMELDDFTTRAVAVERGKDSFKIDWESFVSWSAMPWPEFLTKEPAGPGDFRVVLEIDNYWNFSYNDPTRFFCYKLTDSENWASCWGYCGIDSEVGSKLNRLIRRQRQQGQNQIKALVRLRFEDAGRGHNQVSIVEVLQDGWVTAAP